MKPMLAATIDSVDQLEGKYPLLASPKLDGIRAMVVGGILYSRNMKPIPNKYISKNLPLKHMEGWDGELIVGSPYAADCFRQTTSGVMSEDGNPKFAFYVFDVKANDVGGFLSRYSSLKLAVKEIDHPAVKLLPQIKMTDSFEVFEYEKTMLTRGFEGIMLRTPDGIYKPGRSTMREGYLMKLKQFADSEAVVLALVEQQENTNEKKLNELGKLQRTSHKAGKKGKNTLGSISCRDTHTGVVFDIGSGFDDKQRKEYWSKPATLRGKIIKYKYFPTGSKDKPRFPVFIGLRKD